MLKDIIIHQVLIWLLTEKGLVMLRKEKSFQRWSNLLHFDERLHRKIEHLNVNVSPVFSMQKAVY